MNTNGATEQIDQGSRVGEARLPQIDPITFSALSTLDGFVARAALTRQEHAEANRSMQHVVQIIELLQARVRELGGAGEGVDGGSRGSNGGRSSALHASIA